MSFLEEYPSTPTSGHSGISKTLKWRKVNVYWDGMKKDVTYFVAQCKTCQQINYIPRAAAGLLQPIKPPTQVWEDLSVDFVVHLPAYNNNNIVIVVIIDRFSKAGYFGMLPTNFTSSRATELFRMTVCKLHGYPRSIISYRDPIFVGSFYQTLCKLNGTKLQMSTAYHPHTGGQTEVLNRSLQTVFASFHL